MVANLVIILFLLCSASAWGEAPRERCLSCHAGHYSERGGCSGCHRGNPLTDRKNLGHAGLIVGKYARFTLGNSSYMEEAGQLLDRYACRRCHVVAGRGNRFAVNLDAAAVRKPPGQLAISIRHPVDSMPDFALDDIRTTALVNTILAGSQGNTPDSGAPVIVHFTAGRKKNADVFTRKCGSCHRLLSQRYGSLGSGNTGPNLSGLLTEQYLKSFRDNRPWTTTALADWVKNPRAIRPWAVMRPIDLSASELHELESILLFRQH